MFHKKTGAKIMNVKSNNFSDLSSRGAVITWFESLFESVWNQREENAAGITLGGMVPLYGEKIAAMETFCRLLWGVFPVISSAEDHPIDVKAIFRIIAQGTDPACPAYWGDVTDFDQRSVEMAVFGCGLMLSAQQFKQHLSALERQRLIAWLNQIREVKLPKNNWSFFPIMIETGLCLAGDNYSKETIEQHFTLLDSYYLGDGWYSDGENRPRDYYNAMALHYYGLIYSTVMRDKDPERCAILRQRATVFAHDFIYMFDQSGSAIPFGRSLTYRFAQAAFWSAAAFAGLDSVPLGIIKGIILRNLRWWLQQDMCDSRGVMTVGYSYSNPLIAEDYNAPGSPYWACKAFLILALGEEHPFWLCKEQPLPQRETTRSMPHAGHIVHDDKINHHHYLLNAGQFPAKNYNNSESKYGKFAYSSLLGFNLERSRYGIELNACDSSLLFSEFDGYYRGRLNSQRTKTASDRIFTQWFPWPDVEVNSWLMPLDAGHLRIHLIQSGRALESVEGGFPLPVSMPNEHRFNPADGCVISDKFQLYSSIKDISPAVTRHSDLVLSPPGSNIIFPCSSGVPVLRKNLLPGRTLLASLVDAGQGEFKRHNLKPEIVLEKEKISINVENKTFNLFI